jgi:hypothetical protein
MGIKRHKPEEIVTKLRQIDVLVGQGKSRIDAIVNGGDKLVHGSGGISPAAGGVKLCHL